MCKDGRGGVWRGAGGVTERRAPAPTRPRLPARSLVPELLGLVVADGSRHVMGAAAAAACRLRQDRVEA